MGEQCKMLDTIISEIKINIKIHREQQSIKILRICDLLVIESGINEQRYAPTRWLAILFLVVVNFSVDY